MVSRVIYTQIRRKLCSFLIACSVNASPLLLEEVCCSALDHAKLVFKSQRQGVSNNSVGNDHGASGSPGSASLATRMAVKRKLSMITQYVLYEALEKSA